MEGKIRERRDGRVETLARGLSLLVAFGEGGGGKTLTELARAAGLPKPTAMRMLRTLEEFGFVSREGRLYHVGPRCLSLGNLYDLDEDLRCWSLPVMRELTQKVGEVVQLAVLKGREILYLERTEPRRSVTVVLSRPGSTRPAHCTALGKALLAFGGEKEREEYLAVDRLESRTSRSITSPEALRAELEVTRERGYAVDDTESDEEVRCVAAPIFDGEGRCIAAMSVSAPAYRLPEERQAALGALVREYAGRVTHTYGSKCVDRSKNPRTTAKEQK
ncbi:IclR family transcriptional regulator [Rubrobacter naiadicus]|uniref:IclR family transcriptional regulator n=1 Tax=Rubrobacter naiadicus TaxID=1392641 RepID=UPI00235FC310|nr:IclR family transcriptional regulator [Rubrobacter naiadicus]